MNVPISFSAGKFEVRCYGGWPFWWQIYRNGQEVAGGIHHKEIKDLIYVLGRLQNALRRELGKDGSEVD